MYTFNPEQWLSQHPRVAAWLDRLLHPYTLFLLVALATWLLDGFNIGYVNDGWVQLAAGKTLANYHSTRVFGIFPRSLGLLLVPSGFQGLQMVLLALTVLRGVLMFEIVKRLIPSRPLFAVAAGLVALFHPADEVYFWVDAVGVCFALVLALICCLAALVHLQTRSRESLATLLFFQLLSCFTYSAFLPLIIGFPVGAWLLRRAEGYRDSPLYLLKTSLLVLAFVGFEAGMAAQGFTRDSAVADVNLHSALLGYAFQSHMFGETLEDFFTSSMRVYWLVALPVGLAAWYVGASLYGKQGDMRLEGKRSWRFYALLVAGLSVLAALSYLPYAVSTQRFDNTRMLLAAGIFIYMIFLLPLFVLLPKYLHVKHAFAALLAVLAMCVVVTGLEHRQWWVSMYRTQEGLMSAIAAVVPDPPPGSVIVVNLHRGWQAKALAGFYNRRNAFSSALGLMYGDIDLQAGFTDFEQPPFVFDRASLEVRSQIPSDMGLVVPYDRLVLVDYLPDGSAHILDRAWLQRWAPKGMDLSAYKPGDYGSAPGEGAIICTMLEKDHRPAYCR